MSFKITFFSVHFLWEKTATRS